MAGRNLLTLLNLEGDAVHAATLAWLLDPIGEHGVGDALLQRLVAFCRQRKVAWPPTKTLAGTTAHVRVRNNLHEIEVTSPGDARLVLVVGGYRPGAPDALQSLAAQKITAIGLHLIPGAFPPDVARQHPVWTGQDLLQVLETIEPRDAYGHFLEQYRARLQIAVRGKAGTRRAARPGSGSGPTPKAPAAAQPATAAQQQALDKALAAFGLDSEEEYPDEPDLNLSEEMLPSDDMSRVYVVKRLIGKGGQGLVFEVEVQGEQSFPDFLRPVTRAVLKIARPGDDANMALQKEKAIYSKPNRGIVKLLDSGTANESLYLILERLHPHPSQKFKRRVDPATAIDTFVNALGILKGLHFNRERPLLLFDIKPDNIMLRMSNAEGDVGVEEYLRRIATGAYEPVFMDMGCAESRTRVEDLEGKLNEFIGTPLYLPPESTPTVSGDEVESIYSTKTDVYALTLTFYELLTAERPYQARGLFKLKGQELLLELIGHKHAAVDPINPRAFTQTPGLDRKAVEDIKEVIQAGIHPDPSKRASAQSLLNMCKKSFEVTERRKKEVGEYRFDAVKGLRLWQGRFPRISAEKNTYYL